MINQAAHVAPLERIYPVNPLGAWVGQVPRPGRPDLRVCRLRYTMYAYYFMITDVIVFSSGIWTSPAMQLAAIGCTQDF